MYKMLLIKLSCCLLVFGGSLYSYFDKQNALTQMKIRLPELEREVKLIREEIKALSYEVDQFEHPSHLIELAHAPEFSHLKHPLLREILTVPEDIVAQAP